MELKRAFVESDAGCCGTLVAHRSCDARRSSMDTGSDSGGDVQGCEVVRRTPTRRQCVHDSQRLSLVGHDGFCNSDSDAAASEPTLTSRRGTRRQCVYDSKRLSHVEPDGLRNEDSDSDAAKVEHSRSMKRRDCASLKELQFFRPRESSDAEADDAGCLCGGRQWCSCVASTGMLQEGCHCKQWCSCVASTGTLQEARPKSHTISTCVGSDVDSEDESGTEAEFVYEGMTMSASSVWSSLATWSTAGARTARQPRLSFRVPSDAAVPS